MVNIMRSARAVLHTARPGRRDPHPAAARAAWERAGRAGVSARAAVGAAVQLGCFALLPWRPRSALIQADHCRTRLMTLTPNAIMVPP